MRGVWTPYCLTHLTTWMTLSTGVPGTMPWPRLKMWPGRPAAASRISCDAGFEDVCGGEEGDGVEVALDGDAVADGAPAFVEGDAPVEAEDVGAGFAHGGEEGGGVDAEVDDGDAEGLDAAG